MLTEWRSRARQLAGVLGFDAAAAGAAVGPDTTWYFSGPSVKVFGKEVDSSPTADAARFTSRSNAQGSVALVLVNIDGKDAWTSAQLVRRADVQEWLAEKHKSAGRDPRLLPMRQGPKGRPVRFRDAEANFDPAKPLPLFEFGAVAPESCAELALSEAEPPAAAAAFIYNNGIGASSGFAIDYTMVTWALWSMACLDRLDVARLASGGHLARWALRMQRAARRNPRSPDYEGRGRYIQHTMTPTGLARALAFEKAVAEGMKTEAFSMKQRRMEASEAQAEKKNEKEKEKRGDGRDLGPRLRRGEDSRSFA